MEHNGDSASGIAPTQFEIWLYDGQLKYTFVVVPDDVAPNNAWDPGHYKTPPGSTDYPHPPAGSTTLHQRPYSPDQIFAADSTADWHNPWSLVNNPGIGVPNYALCVKVGDRFGHTVETTYHDSSSTLQDENVDGTVNWTLVYRHRMIWRGLDLFGLTPSNWADKDAYREAFSEPVIDRIYVFEHDTNGIGITDTQINILSPDLIILEKSDEIDNPLFLDKSAPLDEFAHDQLPTISAEWGVVEPGLRNVISYHYGLQKGQLNFVPGSTSGFVVSKFGPVLSKVRTVRINADTGSRYVESKVFKYSSDLIANGTSIANNTLGSMRDISWLELIFTQSDIQSIVAAKSADTDPIPSGLTVNHLALWRDLTDPSRDLDSEDADLAKQLRKFATYIQTPGLYDNGSSGFNAEWPYTSDPASGTWDAPSPMGLVRSPANTQSMYLSALGEDLTARNDGNWSTIGTASTRDTNGTRHHYRIHRLMAMPSTETGLLGYEEWGTMSANAANLSFEYFPTGDSSATDEGRFLDRIHSSVFVNPYYYRSYSSKAGDSLVSVGDLTKPRWIAIVDEFGSREEMMDTNETYGGVNLIKKGQMSRRVVEMNAYGYILKDRTWTYTDDGFILDGGGLGEEFAYLTVRDYIGKANLTVPAWLDDGNGVVSDSGDFSPFLDDIVMVEHRSVGWSVAAYDGDENDPGLLESENGIVRFIEYDLFGDAFSLDDVPLSVRFQKTAEGVKKGTYYNGNGFVTTGSNPLLYTRQYFRDPCRPNDITTDIAFSGEVGVSTKLTSPPDIDQVPDTSVTMTRVLSAYDENASTSGDSYLEDPLVARMVVGSPRQVRPGSPWFYPVEFEHYDTKGLSDWTATGQLEEPINNSATDIANLTMPDLSGNTSPHNSLTWTHYSRSRHGMSDYTLLDAGVGSPELPSDGSSITVPVYPDGWQRFGSVAPHNFVTEFKYDSDFQLIDVYYPNGFRWARRTYSYDEEPQDTIVDYVYEFIFNDLVETSTPGVYTATSPGQYKRYKGENAYGTPEHDKRVRFPGSHNIDAQPGEPGVATSLALAIIASEDSGDPSPPATPYELLAEVLFAVDANGRLQRAEMMDFDPLGRPMAIGYTEINDLGELYRERGIDGTIRTQIRNSLGQTLRRYEGTVDRDWYGDPGQNYEDNMIMKERIEYGLGVNDA